MLKARSTRAEGRAFWFEDEVAPVQISNVIWATGFQSDYRWIQVHQALNPSGMPIHRQGESPVQGLFYLGLPWMRCRASALIGGVGVDASYFVDRLFRQG
ncbi:hypothetical protein N6H14_12350 [Paenibacillus sp. CC-CFT747]|nr:hypothetical protein N6H14_12350 [Paenibacillus sp. CC-CFT747]